MAMTVWIPTTTTCSRNRARPHVTQLGDLQLNSGATAFQVNQRTGHVQPPVNLAYHYARLYATKKENSRIVTSMSRTLDMRQSGIFAMGGLLGRGAAVFE